MERDFSTSDSILSSADSEATDRLWKVLVELNIVHASEVEQAILPEIIESTTLAIVPESTNLFEPEPISDSVKMLPEDQRASAIAVTPHAEISAIEPSLTAAEAFEQLQSILVDPRLIELHESTQALKQELSQLVAQIQQPDELITLLLPHIAEVLKRKVAQSQEEMVAAIAPIIDQAIQRRNEQDQNQMGLALAPAIPDAIAQTAKVSPSTIAEAIAPTMGEAIKKQIQIEQDSIVDALYPIIGGTISKYLAETVRAINQQIENTLSVKGIKRKIQAHIKGISEAELILKEAMPLKTQAAFLIHKTSGIVIAEMQRTDDHRLDSDMVAGMLTAIRSFANDCIAQAGQTSELNEIDYGSSKIILEVAGYCYLAIVIQGEPTQPFIQQVRRALSKIVQQEGNAIASFSGDYDQVPESLSLMLQSFLEIDQGEKTASKKLPIAAILGAGLLASIVIPWGVAVYHDHLRQRIESAIATTPELAVYHLPVEVRFGKLRLTGRLPNAPLRERAEQITKTTLPDWSIENKITVVDIPPDPVLASAEANRITRVLNQLPGNDVSATYQAEQVIVEGTVTQANNVKKIAQAYRQIPGVKSVISTIRVQPLIQEVRIYFAIDSALPKQSSQDAEKLKLFLQQHPRSRFKVVGYSNDFKIASARTKAVQKLLIQQGVQPSRIHSNALAQVPPNVDSMQTDELRRCAIVKAIPSF